VRWWIGRRVSGGAEERWRCCPIAGSRAASRGARRGRALAEVIEWATAESASASGYHEVRDAWKEGLFAELTTVALAPVRCRAWGGVSARYRRDEEHDRVKRAASTMR
jgi:hypothetical protein